MTLRDSTAPLKARFMGPTWGPSGVDRTQVGPMLAPWTLLSRTASGSNIQHPRSFQSCIEPLLNDGEVLNNLVQWNGMCCYIIVRAQLSVIISCVSIPCAIWFVDNRLTFVAFFVTVSNGKSIGATLEQTIWHFSFIAETRHSEYINWDANFTVTYRI